MNWHCIVCLVLEGRCKGAEGGQINPDLDRIMQAEIGTLQDAGSWLNGLCLILLGPPFAGHGQCDSALRGGSRKVRPTSPLEEQLWIYRRRGEPHNCFIAGIETNHIMS